MRQGVGHWLTVVFFGCALPLFTGSASAAINARDNPDCKLASHTCVDSAKRLIEGQWVSRPCWKWSDNYNCAGDLTDTCQPLINRGCGQIDSICDKNTSGFGCTSYTYTYRCLESKGGAFNDCTPLINRGCTHTSLQACNQTWCVNIRNQGGTATQHTYQCLVHRGSSSNSCTPFSNRGCKVLPGSTTVTHKPPKITISQYTYQCLDKASTPFNNCKDLVAKGCKKTKTSTTKHPPAGFTDTNTYQCVDKAGAAFNNCVPWVNKGCKQTASVLARTSPHGGKTYNNTYRCLDHPSTPFNNCKDLVAKGCKKTKTSTTKHPPAGFTDTNTYQCVDKASFTFDKCKDLVAKGCKQIDKQCIYHKPDGACGTYDLTYQCLTQKGTSTTHKICKSAMCINGSCFNMNSPPANDFAPVVAKFAAVTAIGHSMSQSGGVSIFTGSAQHCNKTIFGLKNCCKPSPSKSCPKSALTLDLARKARTAIFVGTFCANKAVFGACLRKQEVWCKFPSKLARIIQKQGRAQLGISWGVPKGPNCRGFTPLELQKIDFSKIDLSEIYADIMAKMKPMVAGKLGQRISNRVSGYFKSGTPKSGKAVP